MWHVKQDTTFAKYTHALGCRTAHTSSIDEKGFIYIYIFKATSAPPRAGTTGINIQNNIENYYSILILIF